MAFQYYLDGFKNYATFTGRARRSEYWYFMVFNLLAFFCIGFAGRIIDDSAGGILAVIYVLASIVPSIALIVRRLHDVGKSGWFYLIGLIPIIGGIWLLVLYCTDSEFGPNQYGPNPKGLGNEDEESDSIQINQIGQ